LIKDIIKGNLSPKFPIYSINNLDRKFSLDKIKKVPKIAILMCGQMRNYDNIDMVKNNKNLLFNKFNCDIFVSTWNKRGYSPYHNLVSEKSYAKDDFSDPDEIYKYYENVRAVNIENFDKWIDNLDPVYKSIYEEGIILDNRKLKGTIVPQFYKIWDANRLRLEYEKEKGFEYDIVIRFRPDMALVEPIPSEFIENYDENFMENKIINLNPPKIYWEKRIYDIFFFGSGKSMTILANQYKNISTYIHNVYDNKLCKNDSCRILYLAAITNNLKVVDIPRCIGDIYRDEPFQEYVNKILHKFN
jgi:hypothetical protein